MKNSNYRYCVLALASLCYGLPLFSQHPAFILRLNGDRTTTTSDGFGSTSAFMPGISASYYPGNWGFTAEYAAFSNEPRFNIENYGRNLSGFTSRNIHSTQWNAKWLTAGISFRKSFGGGLQAGADMTAGIVYLNAPFYSIKDKADGTLIADVNDETKISTASENPLFGLKPTIRLEWFPAKGPIGFNIHASYLGAFAAKEVSTWYRDLSHVALDGVTEQEIRAQVLKAPVTENRMKGPVGNFSFGAGITLQICRPITKPKQTQSATFGEREMRHLHKEKIVHPDLAARNRIQADQGVKHLIAGRLEWNMGTENPGIITNESRTTPGKQIHDSKFPDILSARISARAAGAETSGERERWLRVFEDGNGSSPFSDSSILAVKTNPLYSGHGHSGDNPLYNGISLANILLMDDETGEVLANTKTEKNGNFFFANVPAGTYTVRVSGHMEWKQSYEIQANREVDVSGFIGQGTARPILILVSERSNALLSENQARQRMEWLQSDSSAMSHANREVIKNPFETGDQPTSSQLARPGNPIPGVIIKGGKNPGGIFITTSTDGNGRFEINHLKEGEYRLSLAQTLYFDDEAPVMLP